ncbi:hypothetical protein LTR16_004246 [Cryomyces antarcticus]|uniref:Uncharacterized protein n=1 Tax=Cryomyces antarcticus TaxID=329879 RepID=A0ABR0M6K3_9PEZI|nr:hypothetical protein LTR16_004246 [Cryomyces antarcticus]
MESEGDFPLVAAWLRENAAGTSDGAAASVLAQTHGANDSPQAAAGTSQETNGVHPPPPLPDNVKINIGTIEEPSQGDGQDPDPEFRRRIEELAAREDFQGEEGQRELRNLITEAVTGLAADGQGRDVRRRLGGEARSSQGVTAEQAKTVFAMTGTLAEGFAAHEACGTPRVSGYLVT